MVQWLLGKSFKWKELDIKEENKDQSKELNTDPKDKDLEKLISKWESNKDDWTSKVNWDIKLVL